MRIAGGFDVANLMRTLSALWLLERKTLLVYAACSDHLGGYARRDPDRRDVVIVGCSPHAASVAPDGPLLAPRSNAAAGSRPRSGAGGRQKLAVRRGRCHLASLGLASGSAPAAVTRTLDLATRIVSSLRVPQARAAPPGGKEAARWLNARRASRSPGSCSA